MVWFVYFDMYMYILYILKVYSILYTFRLNTNVKKIP